jgi:hypothetical protein
MLCATGAVNGPAVFVDALHNIADQLEVGQVRSCARQLEVAHVSWKLRVIFMGNWVGWGVGRQGACTLMLR